MLLLDKNEKPFVFLSSDMPAHLKSNLEHIINTCFPSELKPVDAKDKPDFDFQSLHFGCYARYCLQVSVSSSLLYLF